MSMKLAERFCNQKPSGMVRMFQTIEKMQNEGVQLLNLSIGEPDFVTEPDIIDAAAAAGKAGFTHYAPLSGFRDLHEAVCAYWERHHGLKANPDDVVVSCGGLYTTWVVLAALLNPGDEVILFEPYFTPYASQIREVGGVPVTIPTLEENGFAPTIEELRKAITSKTRGIILNSPNNPSGRVFSRKQLEEIATVAEEKDLFVISDEIYDSMVYNDKHICFATLPGMRERTVTITGVSKSHCMTGWRVGYAICPPKIVKTMEVVISYTTYSINTLAMKAAAYALNNHDAKVKERSAIFGSRMKAVAERLNAMKGISCPAAEGAFYLFPNIKGTGLSSEDFAWRLLNDAHVAVLPGSTFGATTGEGHIRIACTQSMETLMQSMDAMEKLVNSL